MNDIDRENLTCILLDLDGTLQDSESIATEANRHGLRAGLGREATDDELTMLKGKAVSKALRTMFPAECEEIMANGLAHYQQNWERIALYAGVERMIEGLSKQGYRLGIVTSKTRFHAERELGAKGLIGWFSCIVAQEDTSEHKPSPLPLLLAAERIGVSPQQCAYIGDQPSDILAASAAGMISGAAIWGEGEKERLAAAQPDLWFDTPEAVVSCFAVDAALGR